MALAMLLLAVVPAIGRAQDSDNQWKDLKQTAGKTVKVTVGAGTPITGTLVNASDDAIIVRRNGQDVSFDRTTIRGIKVFSREKRSRNMLVFGAVGAVAGIIPGAMFDEYSHNEGGGGGAALLLGAGGAAIGVLASRGSGYSTAYSAGASNVKPLGSAASFGELDQRIGQGDFVYVTDSNGKRIAGTVDRLSATSLTIHSGPKSYDLQPDQVNFIRQGVPDSLKNGALLGLAGGAALGIAGAATQAKYVAFHSSHYVVGAAVGGGVGAAIGALIDSVRQNQQVIYARPSQQKTASWLRSVNIGPVVSKNRKGVALSVSF
jgi:hypothetical protein